MRHHLPLTVPQKWSPPGQQGRREGATWAAARSANASRRDFTVNGMLYDPFRSRLQPLLMLTLLATPVVPKHETVLGVKHHPLSLPLPPLPRSRLLFDSVGGLEDCEARRLRTICPPADSFAADPARILRGVRLASRAGERPPARPGVPA